jgi:hypothetical protein
MGADAAELLPRRHFAPLVHYFPYFAERLPGTMMLHLAFITTAGMLWPLQVSCAALLWSRTNPLIHSHWLLLTVDQFVTECRSSPHADLAQLPVGGLQAPPRRRPPGAAEHGGRAGQCISLHRRAPALQQPRREGDETCACGFATVLLLMS